MILFAKNSEARRGFTLVELIVAVGIFGMVMALAVGIFVKLLRTQRAVVALIAMNDNASLALEQVAREIRTGSGFSLTQGGLNFFNAKGEAVRYALDQNAIGRSVAQGPIRHITGNNVMVDRLDFTLTGSAPNGLPDGLQPRIVIVLSVSAVASEAAGVVNHYQTAVSPRLLDS